ALSELLKEEDGFANDFELCLTGTVSKEVLKTIHKYSLREFVKLTGYVSHEESIKLQRSSQVLLLIEIDSDETKCIIAGKLFEYMASQRPILAIGPENWDVNQIISETNTGFVFTYHQKNE